MKKEIITAIILIMLFSIFSGCFETTQNNTDQKPSFSINVLIRGYINNTDGENLEDIEIIIYNSTYNWQNYSFTNKTGYFQLGVFAGSFTINIDDLDYEERDINYDFLKSETRWINVTLVKIIKEEFTFTALGGSEINFSHYSSKVVILDLWATWCGPCQTVMPELKKIYDAYSRDELEIFSVDIDYQRESLPLIQSFIDWFEDQNKIKLDWIFGIDDGIISEKYLKEGAIPTLAIFDQKGRLYYNEAGVHGFTEPPTGYPDYTPLLAPLLEDLID